MAVFNNTLAGASGQTTGGADYEIERSLRFNSSDSAYLSRTPASDGNRRTWSFSCWVKRAALGALQSILSGDNAAGGGDGFFFSSSDELRFGWNGALNGDAVTLAKFRDPSAWYHIAVAVDTTQAIDTNRVKVYVNGVQQTLTAGPLGGTYGTYPAQNYDTEINTATAQWFGRYTNTYSNFYLADVHFIDGQALDPTSFGEFDTNGIWQPIEYTGTYGTNGFHLDFSDNSTAAALGTDTSGNSNTWTVNNISVAAGAGNDSLVDVPTNGTETDTGVGGEVRGNYCTLNPLTASSVFTLTNGNLDVSDSGSAAPVLLSSIAVNSGKWYWEVTLGNAFAYVGAAKPTSRGSVSFLGAGSGQFMYNPAAANSARINGVQYNYSTASTATTGDIIGVALDFDANQIVFYKNGVSMGVFGSNVVGSDSWSPAFKSNTGSSATFNFGQRPFAYTAPSGFKALCTANLPAPVVTKPSEYMDVALYTGNGSTQTISGLEFSPDLVWIKVRSSGSYGHRLVDTVRGATLALRSHNTGAEITETTGLTAFTSDGFSLGAQGDYNLNTAPIVAWTWDAGTTTASNTDGSITSQVRANPSAGFSIVTYTGTGSTATVGHGLGVKPSMIINKVRSAGTSNDNWFVYHSSNFGGDPAWQRALLLNTTGTGGTKNTYPWGADHTSAVMAVNGSVSTWSTNTSGATYVAYCFAPVDGYSSFGSYTGNGSTDGPFVYTGFRPRWILIKASSTSTSWAIWDSLRNGYNQSTPQLYANLSSAEYSATGFFEADLLSNGFKPRNTGTATNSSGVTYIYAAFAESPFQYARAR